VEKLKVQHADALKEEAFKRLVKEIESWGYWDVLRRGVTDLGSKFDCLLPGPKNRPERGA